MEANQDMNSMKPQGDGSFFKQMTNSMVFKLFVVFVLVLFLLIPLEWVSNLIAERKDRENNVSSEIASKWGGQQVLSGPVFAIPFDYKVEKTIIDKNKKEVSIIESERQWIFRLPEHLKVKGEVDPEYLKRGIYQAVVYNTKLNFEGTFTAIDISKVNLRGGEIKWAEAKVICGISDFKGLLSYPKMKWEAEQLELNNSDKSFSLFEGNLVTDIVLSGSEDMKKSFQITMQLRGSRSLNFLPLANQTNIAIAGNWSNPSFNGAFLPENREVDASSFSANWSVPNFSRKLPQQWQGDNHKRLYQYSGFNLNDSNYDDAVATATEVAARTVSYEPEFEMSTDQDMIQVNFLPEVNNYQKINRAAKYGLLIILLTFVSLILVEVIKKEKIHFVQYVLIGVAMVLFYSLLLAFSEHVGFNQAYLISAVATVALIGSFFYMLTQKLGLALVFAGILSVFYGFILFIMQMQDHSLIVGSIGLFVILAVLMRFSAKINWYNLNEKSI